MLLLWAAVALGAAPIQSVDGGLSFAQVRDAIAWRSPEINACLAGTPKRASVRYRFSVKPNGRLGQFNFVSAQKVESHKVTCVGGTLEKYRFPAGDGGVVEWDFARTVFDAGVPDVSESLAPEELPARWVDDASACYDETNPDEKHEGLAALELVALSSGGVVSASSRDVAPVFADTTLAGCLEDQALSWSLPGTGTARRLLVNFAFATSERRSKSFFVPSAPPRMILARQPRSSPGKGGLDKNVIKKVIDASGPRVRGCYELGLQLDPKLGGLLRVHWTIGPDGSVILSEVMDDSLGSERVAACVLDIVRLMKFPPPLGGGNVNVTFPWIFKAAGE